MKKSFRVRRYSMFNSVISAMSDKVMSDKVMFNWNSTWSSHCLIILAALMSISLLQAGCATPVGEVESWPVTNAEESQFSGTVVDVLCELGGNCANECGQGKHQLAIKSQDKGTVLVAKNLNNYSGAVDELWQFCGQQVDVNGLFTEHKGVRFFQVQNIRESGGQWQKATKYISAWTERSGKSPEQAKNWQDHDDRVKDIIEREGRLGLGTQADQDYFN